MVKSNTNTSTTIHIRSRSRHHYSSLSILFLTLALSFSFSLFRKNRIRQLDGEKRNSMKMGIRKRKKMARIDKATTCLIRKRGNTSSLKAIQKEKKHNSEKTYTSSRRHDCLTTLTQNFMSLQSFIISSDQLVTTKIIRQATDESKTNDVVKKDSYC